MILLKNAEVYTPAYAGKRDVLIGGERILAVEPELSPNLPGVQVYDGYYLPVRNAGVALETQHFPDSPNRPEFPNTILRPGQVLHSTTEYRFRII